MSHASSSANPSFPFFDDGLTPDELTELLSHTEAVVRGALAGILSGPSATECLSQGDAHYKTYQSLPAPLAGVTGPDAKQHHLQQAIAHYRKALELQPNLAKAYIKLAQALWTEGHIGLETTLSYCELAIRHEPSQLSHYLAYSQLLHKAGQLHQADGVLTLAQSLAIKPFRGVAPQWAWQRAVTRWQLVPHTEHWGSQVALSLSSVAHGLVGFPYAVANTIKTAMTTTGVVPLTTGEFPTQVVAPSVSERLQGTVKHWMTPAVMTAQCTLARVSQAVGNTAMATQCWETANRWQPNRPSVVKALSELALTTGQTETALGYSKQLLNLNPNDTAVALRTAHLHKDLGQLSQAQTVLEKATAVKPTDGQLFFELGQVMADQQIYLPALMALKEANRLEANHPYIVANMAYVLFKLEDMDGAVTCYRQALDLGTDPVWRSAVAQTLGALYYQFHHDDVAAEETLETAVRLDPANVEAQTMLAELLFETGQLQQSLTRYEALKTLKPDDADVHSHIGYILWQMDRNDEALKAYNTAIHYDKKNAIVYNNMGVIYLDEMYDAQSSNNLFEKALICNPQYTLAAFNLGRSYELMGQTHEAAKAYSKALELAELNPELDKADITDRLHLLFSV